MGVFDFVSRLAALRLVHVGDLVSRGPAKWKVLASYWCGFSLRHVAPEMARLTLPHSDRLSPFYHSVLSSFRSYGDRVADWTKVKLRPLYPIILGCLETEPRVQKERPHLPWDSIWKRTLCTKKTSNKFASLNFKIVHRILPTGFRLRRQSSDSGNCPHCGVLEDTKHIFVDCITVRPAGQWLGQRLGVPYDFDSFVLSNFNDPKTKGGATLIARSLSCFRYNVWLARNAAKFDNKKISPDSLRHKLQYFLNA